MTANDKSYLGYLNKLADEYDNTYHSSVGQTQIETDYFALTEKNESSNKEPEVKVGERVMITKYINIFSKGL